MSVVPLVEARANDAAELDDGNDGRRRAQARLGGLRLLLRVGRTNDIVGCLLVNVCGWLGRLRCRYVLPRYDLTQLARAGALALGLCRCSFMSG